jgi:hypothetical protein
MMKSILFDFLSIATLTVILGLTLMLLIDSQSERSVGTLASVIISIAAGLGVLVRRHRDRAVPIAALFLPLTFVLLMYASFLISWYRHQVEL